MRLQHGVTASVLGRLQPWTFNRRSWGRPNIHQSESFQESGRVPSGYLDHTNFKHVLTCRSARANGLTFPSFEVFASYRPRSEGCNQFIGVSDCYCIRNPRVGKNILVRASGGSSSPIQVLPQIVPLERYRLRRFQPVMVNLGQLLENPDNRAVERPFHQYFRDKTVFGQYNA